MAVVIENRATLGDKFVKGMNARLYDIANQAEQAYSMALNSALGVEDNKATALVKTLKSTNARETLGGKTGVGYLQETTEGEDYKSDSRISTYETQFNFKKKTTGITITEENRDDRIVDSKLSESKDIMIAAEMTKDKDAFSIFNYLFTAQASLPKHLTYFGDGKPGCSVGHPRKDGGTAQSNASATGIPLTHTNLGTGRQALRRQLSDIGQPSIVGASMPILLVPDALEDQAVTITGSDKKSGTANNDLNIYRDGRMPVISTQWINSLNGGSDTAWFLVDALFSPFIFFERQGTKVTTYTTDSNKNYTIDISIRYQAGNKNWRGFWGSKGDNAAYAL